MSRVRKLTPSTPEQIAAAKAIASRPENKKWFPNGYKPLKVDHPQSPSKPTEFEKQILAQRQEALPTPTNLDSMGPHPTSEAIKDWILNHLAQSIRKNQAQQPSKPMSEESPLLTDNSKKATSLLGKRQTTFEGFKKQLREIEAMRTPEFHARQEARRKAQAELQQNQPQNQPQNQQQNQQQSPAMSRQVNLSPEMLAALEAVRARPENKKFFKHRQPQSPAMSKVRKLTPRTPEQEEARKAIMSRPENKKWFPNGYKPLKVDHPQSPAMPRVRKLTPYTPEQAAAAKAIASRPENKKWFTNG